VVRQRVVETNEGIRGEITVEIFDRFARGMRDKGYHPVEGIITSGIREGRALEIGPGPGYVGLEWLKRCPGAALTGLEISPEMLQLARRNALGYGLSARAEYVEGNCMDMPFPDGSFDAVFSNGSLHEWEDPVRALDEAFRVLRPGGRLFVADMRRDVNPLVKWMIYASTKPKEIRPGFLTSMAAAYTVPELREIAGRSRLQGVQVRPEFFGLTLTGGR
jgi:ubiquinone/menaquinone biosynthesis C-methylase UbiE